MKYRPHLTLSAAFAALVAVAIIAIPMAEARKAPAGLYLGTATKLKLKEFTGTVKHPDSNINIRIPGFPRPSNLGNAKGRFSGGFDSAGNSLGFIFPAGIHGRLQQSKVRQGGKKFLISGKWTWRLDRNRLVKRARGKFNLKIVRVLDTSVVPATVNWKMSGPIQVGHDGAKAEDNYRYTGRFSAITR